MCTRMTRLKERRPARAAAAQMGERPGATSRADDATEICPDCGVEEALRDFRGLNRIPTDRWPVSDPGRTGRPTTLDELRDDYIGLVERVGRTLAPTDDWAPVLLVDGRGGRAVVGLGDLFTSEEAKAVAAEVVIPTLLRKLEAWAAALVVSAWVVEGEDAAGVPPSESPRRVEMVAVTVATRDAHEIWIAPILRAPDAPPRLGAWRRTHPVGGLFVEPLRRALCPQG